MSQFVLFLCFRFCFSGYNDSINQSKNKAKLKWENKHFHFYRYRHGMSDDNGIRFDGEKEGEESGNQGTPDVEMGATAF